MSSHPNTEHATVDVLARQYHRDISSVNVNGVATPLHVWNGVIYERDVNGIPASGTASIVFIFYETVELACAHMSSTNCGNTNFFFYRIWRTRGSYMYPVWFGQYWSNAVGILEAYNEGSTGSVDQNLTTGFRFI